MKNILRKSLVFLVIVILTMGFSGCDITKSKVTASEEDFEHDEAGEDAAMEYAKDCIEKMKDVGDKTVLCGIYYIQVSDGKVTCETENGSELLVEAIEKYEKFSELDTNGRVNTKNDKIKLTIVNAAETGIFLYTEYGHMKNN